MIVPELSMQHQPATDDLSHGPKISSRKSSLRARKRHLSLPPPSKGRKAAAKRKFDMQPVPEEEVDESLSLSDDDHASSSSSSSSGFFSGSSDRPYTVATTVSDATSTSGDTPEFQYPYLDNGARLVMELEYVKQIHEQDKQFFNKEIRNLRMQLFEAEATLQHRTEELEFVLQEREAERWQMEELRVREREHWEKEFMRMKESMDLEMRAVRGELDAKRKECSDAMDVLEEAQKELLGITGGQSLTVPSAESRRTRRSSTGSGVSSCEEAPVSSRSSDQDHQHLTPHRPTTPTSRSPLSSAGSILTRYTSIPSRISSLRKQIVATEERFQTSYSAWSSENKYLRKMHQSQLKDVNDDLRKSREEVRNLAADNKKLHAKLNGLKDSLVLSRRESQSAARRSREIQNVYLQVPPTSSPRNSLGVPVPISPAVAVHNSSAEDKVSVDEAMKLVQKLNNQIIETASALVKDLASLALGDSVDPAASLASTPPHSTQTQEAIWLLGGEELTSLLSFVPAPESSSTAGSTKDSNSCLRTLLQIGLTTWSAYHVHSWELGWNGSGASGHTEGPTLSPPPSSSPPSSDGSSPLAAIYRKLKIVEDPAVATKWRSVTRSQIKFSSSAWTQALISSLFSILSFLGLTYTRPLTTLAHELQPLLCAIRSVREALGESVVSKELEAVTVTPGARFDFRCMKDVSAGGAPSKTSRVSADGAADSSTLSRTSTARPKREIVVATCGLGLKEVSLEGFGRERLLALPQVLRERSFSDLLAPIC
ncbi:hypothetical protein EST38_g180 [Candolleomyces aberdarensis]|uniref:Uncharacterized protein n=1 Tax=Candolleomyces aberdarensis TaxID=2316362 RepID=A0A4Q2E1Q5_9AGAR|nr:hypothetical protein EST38_g180 [Candolleomyces aberdarensis]